MSSKVRTDHMNTMPKYVVSTTLKDPQWQNTHVIKGDPVAAISRLKESPGKDIVQYGFGDVSRLLLEHGLVDELRLWVYPLILGRGSSSDQLFGASPAVSFNLVGSTTLSNGIIILNYEIDKMLAWVVTARPASSSRTNLRSPEDVAAAFKAGEATGGTSALLHGGPSGR